jgi:hypothetical protein
MLGECAGRRHGKQVLPGNHGRGVRDAGLHGPDAGHQHGHGLRKHEHVSVDVLHCCGTPYTLNPKPQTPNAGMTMSQWIACIVVVHANAPYPARERERG